MDAIKKYCVYCHINKINGKRYIGITCQDPKRRWNNGKGYKSNDHFSKAIEKYGWESFDHIIICDQLSKHEAETLEQVMIAFCDSTNENKGYNLSIGGECGSLGSKRSPEQTAKKSAQMKIRMKDEKTIEKIRQNRIGMTFSEDHLKHLSESHIGHAPSNKGVAMSEEQKQILRDRKRGKMMPVFCEENGKTYESIKQASLDLNIRSGNISLVCAKKRQTASGYHFKYA